MSLPGLAVRRGVTFTMFYLIVVGAGFYGLSQLRLDMYPDISFPLVGVISTYPGASPEDIETVVSRPIEEAVATIENVKHINSESKNGASVVFVELEWGADTDKAERDIRKNLDLISSILPPDMDDPITFAFDPSMQPIMLLALSGPYSQAELRDISEHMIEPRLERIAGVAQVSTGGGLKREIQVRLLADRMADYGISPQAVIGALRANNLAVPGGNLNEAGREFFIQNMGQFETVDEIREVVVGLRQREPVKLRMVAEVVDTFYESQRIVRHNGDPSVMLIIRKQTDANSVRTCNNIERELPEMLSFLPRGVHMSPIFNQSDFIEQSIGNLSNGGLAAFGLAFLVLLFFLLNFRASLVVASAIPISVVATFLVMHAVDITLNIISLAGLALSVGMLIDNSIVVLENIFRRMEAGEAPAKAAVEGTQEVALAITASTLTTVAVFAPVLFVPGIAGLMFRDMAVTICVSLLTSLAIALTLIPLMAATLVRVRSSATGGRPAHAVGRSVRGWTDGLASVYGRVLAVVLSRRKTTVVVAFGLLALAVGLGGRALQVDFFTQQDSGMIIFQGDAMVGSSIETTDGLFRQVEKIVERTVPEATDIMSDIGTGEGFTAMFAKGNYSGILRLRLRALADRKAAGQRGMQQIEQDLLREFRNVSGIHVVRAQFFSLGGTNSIEVEVYGDDLTQLQRVGLEMKTLVEKVPNASDVTFSLEEAKPEYGVFYDRARLSALGLSTVGVSSVVSTYFQGTLAGRYQEKGWEYDILVRSPKDYRLSKRQLEEVPIVTPLGETVPLKSVADVEERLGPVVITRKDQQRKVTITAVVVGSNMGQVVEDVQKMIDQYQREHDVPELSFKIAGTAEDFLDSMRYLGLALVVAILLVYMVMASQFEALISPFVIFFSIPLAAIGVVAILLLTGTALSVPALIGVIMLVGVVVNNGIVLVDYTNQLRQRGKPLLEAMRLAGETRMRPVLMTALTTILAMVPLALELGEGSEGWSPMARVIIGGLFASTFLTLIVVPVIYVMIEGFRERWAARRASKSIGNP